MKRCACIWLLVVVMLLESCATCGYFYDGGSTKRPYYKACTLWGRTTVECDSANKLPNGDCK